METAVRDDDTEQKDVWSTNVGAMERNVMERNSTGMAGAELCNQCKAASGVP